MIKNKDSNSKADNKEKIWKWLLKLLWPERCPFCMRAYRTGICPECQKKLKPLFVTEPRCVQCGKPLHVSEKEYCYDCAEGQHYFDAGSAVWVHKEPVSNSIYQFKYHNQRAFAKEYAKVLVGQFEKEIRRWNPDVLIPVPLHKKRKKKRGYNQAELLAAEIGRLMNLPVETDLVVRTKNTKPQKNQGHRGRKQNLKQAFGLKYRFRKGCTIVVIDDIYTTGNTIDAISFLLKKAGAEKVYFLTISIGQGY